MMTKKENELSPATSRWPYHRRRPSWFDKLLKNMKCKKADKTCFEIKIRLEKYRLRRYWSDKLECATLQHVTLSQWYITGQRAWVGGWQISRVSVLNYFIILMVIQRKCPGLLCRCQHYYNSWHFFLLLRQGRHRQQICVRSENLQLTAQYPVIVQCSTVV